MCQMIWLLKCESLPAVNEYFKDIRRLKSINTLSHWKRSAENDWLCRTWKNIVNECCIFGDTKSAALVLKNKMKYKESMLRKKKLISKRCHDFLQIWIYIDPVNCEKMKMFIQFWWKIHADNEWNVTW